MFQFDNPRLRSMNNGEWDFGIFPLLPEEYARENIVFTYFIEYRHKVYQAEIIRGDAQHGYFTYIHKKTTPIKDTKKSLIYTLDQSKYGFNYSQNLFRPQNNLQERVAWFYNTNRVYYQDPRTGSAIQRFMEDCR